MSNVITPEEWKEIEGYLLERPQCKIDEAGVIWFQVDDVIRGGMHPRMFLDICRDEIKNLCERAVETNRILDQNFKDECDSLFVGVDWAMGKDSMVVYEDDLGFVEDLGACFTVAGIRALAEQLTGAGVGFPAGEKKLYVSDYNECLMECIRYNALYQILRGC